MSWLLPSLKLTAKAPEYGCLEDDPFRFGANGLFSGANWAVSFRECDIWTSTPNKKKSAKKWADLNDLTSPKTNIYPPWN